MQRLDFMIAAFHGFVLQMEWDAQLKAEPYIRLLDTFLESLVSSR
jgi:hypothetical protein